ncbi:crotonase/enoyl-CoA hydratase family protein [Microbacterium sp. zg-Y818]|uniref:crotonase/enoyl-CoA hydratase family protein n=1 Tax=unclassified Microbacterium TaxID=2609290 RepID=UPI00214C6513|nr:MULTISPECIES: crotonase/enoyl-CoA hydratase family protein [unclassified Microbacterium]MCR2799340.1 crotonase/enoyl-CoA hydratase family protein [Microbacterium sp. zg.Y818]WIM21340.1 crotonase/enoyl-CoA hydratase family protein [Microbacterium sp. zg-Y818]
MSRVEPVVLTATSGRILVITLNRPNVRNAVDGAVARGIHAALDELDADPSLSVGIVQGAGPGFCAGNDLKNLGDAAESPVTGRGFAGIVERPAAKPLIAAVEGFAAGGGFEIALACDLIVAGRSARFMLPEVTRGLVAGGGGILRLLQRAPRARAVELLLTGAVVTAQELGEWGVLNRVVDDGDALEAAHALAEAIAANSPVAVAATKRIIDECADWPESEFFQRQRPILTEAVRSPDAREGARAFLEKRAAQWPSAQVPTAPDERNPT